MHDPMTVICDIPNPFLPRYSWGKRWKDRPSLVTLWHVDPEKRGDDDSCDWFNHRRPLTDKEEALQEAMYDMETLLDNRPHYPDSPEHKAFQTMKRAVARLLAPPPRAWWKHPRFHLWHWKFQVHLIQHLKRWLFSRCATCGKGFSWGYAPVSSSWNSKGPRWFRSEEYVSHSDCRRPSDIGACQEAKT